MRVEDLSDNHLVLIDPLLVMSSHPNTVINDKVLPTDVIL